jgi:hypothetical protein
MATVLKLVPVEEHRVNMMRKAGRLSGEARAYAASLVRPGITTREIDKALYKFIRSKSSIFAVADIISPDKTFCNFTKGFFFCVRKKSLCCLLPALHNFRSNRMSKRISEAHFQIISQGLLHVFSFGFVIKVSLFSLVCNFVKKTDSLFLVLFIFFKKFFLIYIKCKTFSFYKKSYNNYQEADSCS